MSLIRKKYGQKRPPEVRAAAALERRESALLARIAALENKSLRCIRALQLNAKDASEKAYLKNYEEQIQSARDELTALRAEQNEPAPAEDTEGGEVGEA